MKKTTNFYKLAIVLNVIVLFSASCTKQIDRLANGLGTIDKFVARPIEINDVTSALRKPSSYVGTSTIGDTLTTKNY